MDLDPDMNDNPRPLDGYGRCDGCGEDYSACAGRYYCDECEADAPREDLG
jgi:hypothetical protein